MARFQVTQEDAEFVLRNLPRLPGGDQYDLPITVDLNGQVAIRARADGQTLPTELVPTGATLSGDPGRLNTNRRYLARPLKLGFREVHVFSPKAPVLCQDRDRTYVWALAPSDLGAAPGSRQPATAGFPC